MFNPIPYYAQAFCNNEALPVVNTANLSPEEFMKHFTKLLREAGRNSQIDEEELLLKCWSKSRA